MDSASISLTLALTVQSTPLLKFSILWKPMTKCLRNMSWRHLRVVIQKLDQTRFHLSKKMCEYNLRKSYPADSIFQAMTFPLFRDENMNQVLKQWEASNNPHGQIERIIEIIIMVLWIDLPLTSIVHLQRNTYLIILLRQSKVLMYKDNMKFRQAIGITQLRLVRISLDILKQFNQ